MLDYKHQQIPKIIKYSKTQTLLWRTSFLYTMNSFHFLLLQPKVIF